MQFTLYANIKKNKPDFRLAMGADRSRDFYQLFLERLRKGYRADRIKGDNLHLLLLILLEFFAVFWFAVLLFLFLVRSAEQRFCFAFLPDGVFGAMMEVQLVNDGPVTIELDSVVREPGSHLLSLTGSRLLADFNLSTHRCSHSLEAFSYARALGIHDARPACCCCAWRCRCERNG